MSIKTVSKGITRIELDERKGYLVRISRNGERVNKYFSDSVNGGKKKALAIAKQTYADLLEEYGPVENTTKGKLTSRNNTGIVGVHLAYSRDSRYPGCEYYAYCASWITEEGQRKKASFAFNKYGEEEAFDLAVLAREQENNNRDEVVAIYEKSAKGKKMLRARKKAGAAKKSVKKATKKSSAKKPVKKLTKKSAKKSARKNAKKNAKKSVRKANKKSTRKSVKKSAKKSAKLAKKSVKKSSKKQAKKKASKKTSRRR